VHGVAGAIRSGDLDDSNLMSRRLGEFAFVLCASPAYCARSGTPAGPLDLARHDTIRFRFPTSGKLQDWRLPSGPRTMPSMITCNNMEGVRAAAIAGLGIASVPDFLVQDAVDDGMLVTLLDDYRAPPGQFSILWPSSRQLSARLRAFVDFAADRLFA
jgi:DNA-binding transcriptional LysR family regulator